MTGEVWQGPNGVLRAVKIYGRLEPELVALAKDALENLSPASFQRSGRTALVPIQRAGRTGDLAIKIKGFGGRMPGTDHLIAPSRKPFYRVYPHFGFDAHDNFYLEQSEAAPTAGITLSKAAMELEVADRLSAHDPPLTPTPIALLELDEEQARFPHEKGERLGVAIVAHDQYAPPRVDQIITPDAWPQSSERFIQLLDGLGFALARFHQAGFYRFSATIDNYGPSRSGTTQLIDLDSSKTQAGLSARRVWLEKVRDVVGAVFNTARALIDPARVSRLPPSEVRLDRFFESIIQGYARGAALSVEPGQLSSFATWFGESYARTYENRVVLLGQTDFDLNDRFRRVYMNHVQSYAGLMVLLVRAGVVDGVESKADLQALVEAQAKEFVASFNDHDIVGSLHWWE